MPDRRCPRFPVDIIPYGQHPAVVNGVDDSDFDNGFLRVHALASVVGVIIHLRRKPLCFAEGRNAELMIRRETLTFLSDVFRLLPAV